MRNVTMALCLILVGISFSPAEQQAQNKVVLDLWDAAFLRNGKAGYVHTFTEEVKQNNQTLLRTTVELRLTVKRNEEVIRAEHG